MDIGILGQNKDVDKQNCKSLKLKNNDQYFSGHSFSWGYGHPELLTQCFDKRGPISGHFGPMNPAKNNTYTFLSKFFKEILKVFKDQYIHLGNDEVPLACWYVDALIDFAIIFAN